MKKKEKKGMNVTKNVAKLYIYSRYIITIALSLVWFFIAYLLCSKLLTHGILLNILFIVISIAIVVYAFLVFLAALKLFKVAKREINTYKDNDKINIKTFNDKCVSICDKELDAIEEKHNKKKLDKKKKRNDKKNKLSK